jgi:hypothetical protein
VGAAFGWLIGLLFLGAVALSAYLFLSSSALLVYSEFSSTFTWSYGSGSIRKCTFFTGVSTATIKLNGEFCPRWGKVRAGGIVTE